MSKFTTIELWNERYGNKEDVYDYSGRLMKKSACGNPNSKYHPTLDHIRPLSQGGKDIKGNIEICHRDTNEETQIHYLIGRLTVKGFRQSASGERLTNTIFIN